jgi:hypothetical protein
VHVNPAVDPAPGVQVEPVTLVGVTSAGTLSTIVMFGCAADGPLLDTVNVYNWFVLETIDPTTPVADDAPPVEVFIIDRSASSVPLVTSGIVLFKGVGSCIVQVGSLFAGPVGRTFAFVLTDGLGLAVAVPVIVIFKDSPFARFRPVIVYLIVVVPEDVIDENGDNVPFVVTKLLNEVKSAVLYANSYVNSVTVDGPALVIVLVYKSVDNGLITVSESDNVTAISAL